MSVYFLRRKTLYFLKKEKNRRMRRGLGFGCFHMSSAPGLGKGKPFLEGSSLAVWPCSALAEGGEETQCPCYTKRLKN